MLLRRAKRYGLSAPSLAKAQALSALELPLPRVRRRRAPAPEPFRQLFVELHRIGSNLNQLARAYNAAGRLAEREELMRVAGELGRALRELRAALGLGSGKRGVAA